MKKKVDFLDGTILAHRGIHNESVPENSLTSFAIAVEKGYGIELDVHLLKDQTLVVFHDDTLLRMTGVEGRIKDLTYEEVKDLRLDKTSEKIPTLQEVLSLVGGKVGLDIEIKTDAGYKEVTKAVVKELNHYPGPYCITSFHPLVLYWLKKHHKNIIRGQLISDFNHTKLPKVLTFLLRNMFLNGITKPDILACSLTLLQDKKIQKQRSKKWILAWTVKNEKELKVAKKYSDSIIAEHIW